MNIMTYGHRELDALSFEEKINPTFPYTDFQEYLDETPEALTELSRILFKHAGELRADHVLALGAWAQQQGMDVELIGENTQTPTLLYDGDLDITTCSDQRVSTDTLNTNALDDLKEAERMWLRQGQWAPVVVVEFRGQYQTEAGEIQPSDEASRCSWDGSFDMFKVKLDERNAHCITDSYESDNLRDEPSALDMAVDWEGPYEVRVALFRPSARFISMKEQFRLDTDTPQANSGARGGMRL